jgi:hypothetical protein
MNENMVRVSRAPAVPYFGDESWRVTGAWGAHRVGRRTWRARFLGTHQRVPFTADGRTAGRALHRLARMVDRAQIPVR